MNAIRLGRLFRAVRVQQGLTQGQLARRAGVSRQAVSLLERGHAGELRTATLIAIAEALGGRLDVRLFWNGPELDRQLDARHAAISASVKRRLERWGWLVRAEVSFNRYGDRGRIDLLAYEPTHRALVIVEVKTDLVDVQALLGTMDTRLRVSRFVAGRFGWEPRIVVAAIAFAEDRTIRNRLIALSSLFSAYRLRGRTATSWLRIPNGDPGGLLWFTSAGAEHASPFGRQRVVQRRPRPERAQCRLGGH
jgi:transcriptional regulator with XRE-family HTH domain